MIDELDFHESVMPDDKCWKNATPHLALLVMWAFHQNHLSDEMIADDDFIKSCREFDNEILPVFDFVADFLDGAIIEGYFASKVANFLSDYVSLGVYFGDLEKYFNVATIYTLPHTMAKLSTFFDVLNKRYEHHSVNGEFPAYRTLEI